VSVGARGVEVRTGGVGESELERLVSMSSGPELLVRNSSLSLSTSGHGELRGSEDGEEDGKEEVEEEGKEDADTEEEEDGVLIPNDGFLSETNTHRYLFRQFSYTSNISSDTRTSSLQSIAVS